MADLTYSSGSATDYAQRLLGDKVTVDSDPNATFFIGTEDQRAIFEGGDTNAPDLTAADDGLIFSSGNVEAFNDDDTDNDFVSTNVGGAGDADLDALETTDNATQDAAGIVITFTADYTGELQFALTFTTEEFPEYVDSVFDDKAAVFFAEQGDPLAPVDIANTESGYFSVDEIDEDNFVDNNSGAAPSQDQTDFNGYQANEVVSVFVEEGKTYTLKVAVADVSDGGFDSAILISAICFCAGTQILTSGGPVPVEGLHVGDTVLTRDHGIQQIRWIGKSVHSARGDLAPIHFMKGAIGNTRALRVSPNHKVLLSGWRVQLLFGEDEVLVPAKFLVNGDTIYAYRSDDVEYYHILLDEHALVLSNGIWSESFHPGPEALRTLDHRSLLSLQQVLAHRRQGHARPTKISIPKSFEARVFSAEFQSP
ncbi:MAG: Hint domain-containing protein [Pseudomonadota bacterium]